MWHGRRVVTGHRYHLPPYGLLRLGGPVVLQHLLLVALWILGGLIVGVSCVFPRELWMRLTFRNTSLAVAAYCLGRPSAANLQRRFGIRNLPFRRRFRLGGVWAKGRAAPLYAWDGRVMLTVLTSPPSDEHALEPQSAIERASFGLHSAFGAARDESAGTRIPQIVVADLGNAGSVGAAASREAASRDGQCIVSSPAASGQDRAWDYRHGRETLEVFRFVRDN